MTVSDFQSDLWEMVMEAQRMRSDYMQECGSQLEDIYYWLSEQIAVESKFMKKMFEKCLELDEKCRSCGNEYFGPPHHIIYKSQGGPDELWNLITLCSECHERAHNGFWIKTHLVKKDSKEIYRPQKMHHSGRTFMRALLGRMVYSKTFRWQKALDKLEERK